MPRSAKSKDNTPVRFVYAIIAFAAGLALLGLGINQLTAETEETHVVETEGAEDAPFTVVTNDVIDAEAGRDEFTIEAEGEYLIALGRTYDVEAWLDDAAHNRVTGFEASEDPEEPSRITADYVDGETDVPEPTESDLWVSVETAEGEMPYRWDTPDEEGDWALLIYREGDEPAPAAITTTETVTYSHTGGIALLVSGALVILLALGLFYWAVGAPRRRKNAQAASAASAAPAAGEMDQDEAPAPGEDDATQEFVPAWTAPAEAAEEPTVEESAPAADDTYSPTEATAAEHPETVNDPVDDQGDDEDDDEDAGPMNAPDDPAPATRDNSERLSGWAKGLRDRLGGGKSPFAAVLAVLVALVSGLGLAGPAHADDGEEDPEEGEDGEVQEDAPADVDAEELEEDNGAGEETGIEGEVPSEGYSVLLSSQLESIMEDIAQTVDNADEERDAELLEDRVAGDALDYRELAYRNYDLAETSMPTPIGTEVLSAAVSGDTDFPRQAVVIVEHPDAEVPQVLIIEQATARENYKLVHTAMMAPGTEFPAVSAEQGGVSVVSPGDAEESGTPAAALQGVSRWFVDEDHDFGEQVAESVYIDALHEYHDELTEAADDTEIEFADPEVDLENASALELPDGTVVVAGSFDMTMEMSPIGDGDTIFLEHDLVVEFVGTDWTTFPTRITSREFVVLHIPPEDSEEEVVLVGVDNLISDAEINTPEGFDDY
jgi:type II secretory pathway pseudopilin PulG